MSGGGPSVTQEATFAEVTRRRRRVPKPPPLSACVGGPRPSARSDGVGVAASQPVALCESVVVVKEVNDTVRTGHDIRARVTRVEDLRRARLRVNRVSAVHKAVVIEVRDSESRQKILSSSGLREAGLIEPSISPGASRSRCTIVLATCRMLRSTGCSGAELGAKCGVVGM